MFAGTGVAIRSDRCRYLGAAVGSATFAEQYITTKVNEGVAEIQQLTEFARSQPQAADLAFAHLPCNKWTFLCRIMPGMSTFLNPLLTAISDTLIPTLIDHNVSTTECEVLALLCRHGGLGLPTHPLLVRNAHYLARSPAHCLVQFSHRTGTWVMPSSR